MTVADHEKIKSTSSWAAALRAAEHSRADAFIDDSLARLLCSPSDYDEITAYPAAPTGAVVVRARLGDEVIKREVGNGVRQVVCLGAGADTRAFRLNLPGDLHYYEVDLPGQLASRDAILANNGCVTTCTRVPVNVDLADNWIEALSCAGWTPRRPTVWVAEGLLYYLPYQLCDQLVDQISLASAPRSSFVLDVPHERFLMDEYARPYRLFLERRGSPYRTALVNPRSWLLRRGWTAQAYLSHDLRAGRCPLLPPVPDRLLNYTDIWHVTARHPRRRKA